MKTLKHFVLSLCLIASFITTTNAQVDVTINPIGALWGNIDLGVDFMVSDKFSAELTLGPNVGSRGISINNSPKFKYFALPVTAFGKYYFNPRNGADRFYADAFLRFVPRSLKAEDNDNTYADARQTRVGLGFGIGYKAVSDGGFVFDVGFGVGRTFVNSIDYIGDGIQEDINQPPIMVVGKLGIGYRFGGGR